MTREGSVVVSNPALDAFPEAVISHDATGVIVRWNQAATQLLGRSEADVVGWPLEQVLRLSPRNPTGRHPERQWASSDAVTVPVEVTTWQSTGNAGTEHHLCLRDAAERVAGEDEVARAAAVLRRQARFDALTGLANRYELEERLTAALAGADHGAIALLVVDLDGFKPINDSFGHAVGDEMLAAVAARLKAAVREGDGRQTDTVARLGGDEFVILTAADPEGPSAIVRRIRQALEGPITTTAGPLRIGASVGIAMSQSDSDPDELLRRADKAMFRSKLARSR
jgi:diguanylate cyclase (GGDEF)-like protein